jgi:hypothetical protein
MTSTIYDPYVASESGVVGRCLSKLSTLSSGSRKRKSGVNRSSTSEFVERARADQPRDLGQNFAIYRRVTPIDKERGSSTPECLKQCRESSQ